MKICVCVKYVPGEGEILLTEDKRLDRDGMAGVINPFDLYAVEAALRIKDKYPDTFVLALTMGTEESKRALKECLAVGVDEVCLLSDERLIGADTSLTAKALKGAISNLEKEYGKFDAIFTGSKTIDGGTSQLAVKLADTFDYPSLTFALTAEYKNDSLEAFIENDEGNRIYDIKLPAVLSFTKAEFTTRYPNISRIISSEKADIRRLTLEDIGEIAYKRNGQIVVKESEYSVSKKQGLMIEEKLGEDSAKKLVGVLFEEHLL